MDIIVAFPKIEDAKNLRKLLIRNGYDVNMVYNTGLSNCRCSKPFRWWNSDMWI